MSHNTAHAMRFLVACIQRVLAQDRDMAPAHGHEESHEHGLEGSLWSRLNAAFDSAAAGSQARELCPPLSDGDAHEDAGDKDDAHPDDPGADPGLDANASNPEATAADPALHAAPVNAASFLEVFGHELSKPCNTNSRLHGCCSQSASLRSSSTSLPGPTSVPEARGSVRVSGESRIM